MKPFVINRDSWHYRMNTKHNPFPDVWEKNHSDFCSYWRATIGNIMRIMVLVTLGMVTFGMFVHYAWENPIEVATVSAVIFGGIIAGFVIWSIIDNISSKPSGVKKKQEGLIAQRYRAYKEKICQMVDYEGDK